MPGARATYKKLLEKIAEHGSTEVEELDLGWNNNEAMKAERVIILLEMLFKKGTEGSISAAQYYLDRILGKPKESLNLTNGTDLIGKLTDDQLLEKVRSLLKATGEGGAGESS